MNKFLSFLLFTLLLLNLYGVTHAAVDCSRGVEDPNVSSLICPIMRVVNIVAYVVGTVFIIMILWGAFKLSLAWGDPKSYASAISTWYWVVIGFGVVVGFYAFANIVATVFGMQLPNPVETFQINVCNFLRNAGINSC